MKVLFVEIGRRFDESFVRKRIKRLLSRDLPNKLSIGYISQYKGVASILKEELEKAGKEIVDFSPVLGCSLINKKDVQLMLLVADGSFHAKQLAARNDIEIVLFPSLEKITKKEIEIMKKKEMAKLSRLLSSDVIGIFVSVKPGQARLKEAEKLRLLLSSRFPDKRFFIFLGNTLRPEELENFKCDIWINTACPGIAYENTRIVNATIIEEFLKK